MDNQTYRWRSSCLLLVLLFFVVGAAQAKADVPMEYEEYRSQLELEYFIPFIMYDGSFSRCDLPGKNEQYPPGSRVGFCPFAARGGADQPGCRLYLPCSLLVIRAELFTKCRSTPASPWGLGFWEQQTGISLLASRHFTNEDRLDLRGCSWRIFTP